MTDLSLWNTYEDTILFLRKLEKRSKKRKETSDIPCKPVFKIIEDELEIIQPESLLKNVDPSIEATELIEQIQKYNLLIHQEIATVVVYS
jgi:hypothetical protein